MTQTTVIPGEQLESRRKFVIRSALWTTRNDLVVYLHAIGPPFCQQKSRQPFGISFSTIWSMVKLADLARGGNSLKLSSHSCTIACAAY